MKETGILCMLIMTAMAIAHSLHHPLNVYGELRLTQAEVMQTMSLTDLDSIDDSDVSHDEAGYAEDGHFVSDAATAAQSSESSSVIAAASAATVISPATHL